MRRLNYVVIASALAAFAMYGWVHDEPTLDRLDAPNGGQLRMAGNYHYELLVAPASAQARNAPVTVLEQVLVGKFADGLGNIKKDAKRIDFDPFPYESFAIWIMTQMKRWGQIKGDVDYAGIAAQVYLATDTRKVMAEMGLTPPASAYKSFSVMGKSFDPAKPEDYLASFKIRKAS